MVKIASNVLGPLRDIRLSDVKSSLNGKNRATPASQRALLEQAEETLRAREQAGYERGQRDAEERCNHKVEQLQLQWETHQRAEVLRLFERLDKSIQGQLAETFRSLEKHVVLLAAEAAIKLTAGIPISADMVEACVREAMSLVEQDTELTVALHPDDMALLEQHQSSLLNRSSAFPVLRFRADPKLSRGGCTVETKFGEIDARRETKIELLKKAVNE